MRKVRFIDVCGGISDALAASGLWVVLTGEVVDGEIKSVVLGSE